ncbi:MAG: hypothetical protein SFW62_04445 [Alphaproteobacteria bacterium]|nr:hypothetical protein [Alphaproteobacteria bacterium]
MPKEIDAVGPLPPEPTPPPEAPAPIPPGSNLPALRRQPVPPMVWRILTLGASAVGVLLLLILIFGRQYIATIWPSAERYYHAVGLHIYHYGEGLSFEDVRSELRYEGGIMRLAVEGAIRNGTKNVQEMPHIVAVAIGSDGKPMQSWQIEASATRVPSGGSVPFRSSIIAPRETVTEISLSFVEIEHESK